MFRVKCNGQNETPLRLSSMGWDAQRRLCDRAQEKRSSIHPSTEALRFEWSICNRQNERLLCLLDGMGRLEAASEWSSRLSAILLYYLQCRRRCDCAFGGIRWRVCICTPSTFFVRRSVRYIGTRPRDRWWVCLSGDEVVIANFCILASELNVQHRRRYPYLSYHIDLVIN